jgi:hypothetical protein
MDLKLTRFVRMHALSLTTIASKLASTGYVQEHRYPGAAESRDLCKTPPISGGLTVSDCYADEKF